MNREKHRGCCGHSHGDARKGCAGGRAKITAVIVTSPELEILGELIKYHYLPVSRFVRCSTHTDGARFIALAPVYLEDKADSMEKVRAFAARLELMAEKGLISLDYGYALQGYDYEIHSGSDLFRYFESTVREAAPNAGFLCDTAELEPGSIAMTRLGMAAAKKFLVDMQ